jgi:hypothetical protein
MATRRNRQAPKARSHPKSATERTSARRERRWTPDLRDQKVRAEIRREAALLAKHPENEAIDAWIERVYDSSEWR